MSSSENSPQRGDEQVSVLVLTKNERRMLPRAMPGLAQLSSDIHVLDSRSTDGTQQYVKEMGMIVHERDFDDWGSHSNWALQNIPFANSWVYYSDADEVLTPELLAEVRAVVANSVSDVVAYRVRYLNFFRGRWLRHGGVYPVWVTRLFRPERVRYEERSVNAHPQADGPVGELGAHFEHYTFGHGMLEWLEKHNRYSTYEASEMALVRGRRLQLRAGLAYRDPERKVVRRRLVKELSFRVRFRGPVRFLYSYLFKAGFLDGAAGLHYALLISCYEHWSEIKSRMEPQARQHMQEAISRDLQAIADAGHRPRALGWFTRRYLRYVVQSDLRRPWGLPPVV